MSLSEHPAFTQGAIYIPAVLRQNDRAVQGGNPMAAAGQRR